MLRQGYLIGEVSQMCGISRDTLRFYEKKGVITSRKLDNGYRCYSEKDIFSLFSILYRRRMNMSLEEIGTLNLKQGTYEMLRELTDKKIREEELAIERHRQVLTRLRTSKDDCQKIENHLGRFRVCEILNAYIVDTCPDFGAAMRRWFDYARERSGLDLLYTLERFDEKDGRLRPGEVLLIMKKEVGDQLSTSVDFGACPRMEGACCIHTVVKSDARVPDMSAVRAAVRWAESLGLRPSGQIYSMYLQPGCEEGVKKYYLELFMPLAKV